MVGNRPLSCFHAAYSSGPFKGAALLLRTNEATDGVSKAGEYRLNGYCDCIVTASLLHRDTIGMAGVGVKGFDVITGAKRIFQFFNDRRDVSISKMFEKKWYMIRPHET